MCLGDESIKSVLPSRSSTLRTPATAHMNRCSLVKWAVLNTSYDDETQSAFIDGGGVVINKGMRFNTSGYEFFLGELGGHTSIYRHLQPSVQIHIKVTFLDDK